MNRISFPFILVFVLQASLKAQPVALPTFLDTNAPVASVAATIIGRSANERKWGLMNSVTNADGSVSTVPTVAYTELGSGLCKFSTESNAWVDADTSIDIVATGAAATGTRHLVTFTGDGASPDWALKVTATDGGVFAASVYGLAYYDSASGSNLLLGKLQPCQGTVVGVDEVVYSNAISGSVAADLEYFNKLAGTEQNLVIRSFLPSPESFTGAGLKNATTMLEVWTEWLAPIEPQVSEVTASGNPDDLLLDFGSMKIVEGQAFVVPHQPTAMPVPNTHVLKRWVVEGGRKFLIESVPYDSISNAVRNLPPQAAISEPGSGNIKNISSLLPLQPRMRASATGSLPMKVAQSQSDRPGFAIDYMLVSSGISNYVFQAGNTYYVSIANSTYMFGSNFFEPGVVVKFTNNPSGYYLSLQDPNGAFVFGGTEYAPTVFTSCDDDTVGDKINHSTGVPTAGGWFLWSLATNAPLISHARFSFANTAYSYSVGGPITVRDCQFEQCDYALSLPGGAVTNEVYLQNILAAHITNAVVVGPTFTVYGEQITADNVNVFAWSYGNGYTGYLTNSMLTAIYGSIGMTMVDCVNSWVNTGLYQTVGNGAYYLANGSTNRGAGTTNIDAGTLADLQNMTTYPPVVYSNATLAVITNFGQTVLRDGTGGTLDIGYHYPSLDYVFGGTMIGSNVTFLPGVAVGWFNPLAGSGNGYGIYLSNYVTASFAGTVEDPVWWVRANTVQEIGYGGKWPSGTSIGGLVGDDDQYSYNIGPSPVANLFFTKCSILGAGDGAAMNHFRDANGYLIVQATDSEFYGGCIGAYIVSCTFTNCLFVGMQGAQIAGWTNDQWIMRACTWHNGYLTLEPYSTPMTISIRDCAFDGTVITVTSYGTNTINADYSYNAFSSSNLPYVFPVGDYHSVTNTNGFNWQTSWLGNFYLPPGSSNLNAGDLSATNYGLYYYTTQTNQTIQGTNIVDIAYHYVATDAYGNPLEVVEDGLPDYLSDAMVRGLLGPGEINWILNPYSGAGASGLEVFTPLQ